MILEFQGKVFMVISFNWEILQIMRLEETTFMFSVQKTWRLCVTYDGDVNSDSDCRYSYTGIPYFTS